LQSGADMKRWRFTTLVGGAAALFSLVISVSVTSGQSYPTRTIKFVVTSTPGSPTDALARIVMHQLQTRLGTSVIIENQPGAGTTVAARMVARATPDGYTLLFTPSSITYYPVLFPNLMFDPVQSLVPVAIAWITSHVLVVATDIPARTIMELVAYAKANPGKLVFGYGLGSPPHLVGEAFKRAAGIELTGVPYRGGEQARTDLLGGRVHINIAPVATLLSLIRDEKVRPLAYTGSQRSPELSDVPTMIESGLLDVGFHPDVWWGILAPAGTPVPIVHKLNAEINESLKSPELKATLAKLGYEPKVVTAEEFAAFFAAEAKKWPPILRAAGLTAQ
jgi:tripartite-type tricarboxylate transporter receptor subunit TctC